MRAFRCAALALLGALCAQQALATCYVVYGTDDQMLYRSTESPVDLSQPLHLTLPKLAPGGKLVTYGPYFENGVPPAPSNVAFDQSLREHDPSWGIRLREDVEQAAAHAGLRLHARHAMPANNLLLVWGRAG